MRSALAVVAGAVAVYAGGMIYFGASPLATDSGYMPTQPVPYSHALHAGKLGIDCRYCHIGVEDTAHASVPATATCMNCHANIKRESNDKSKAAVKIVRDAYEQGAPLKWVKIHDLPDYAYFNHSAHVQRGIGCVSCHGRVDQMEVVYQDQPLSMGWCLDCHRNPERFLRPVSEVTNMTWVPPDGRDPVEYGRELARQTNIKPSQDCSTCHR